MECINLAGHVTNFVDNDASLEFLQSSHPGTLPAEAL
jgi:hypothetical protein